eukprot:EG_transcript_19770
MFLQNAGEADTCQQWHARDTCLDGGHGALGNGVPLCFGSDPEACHLEAGRSLNIRIPIPAHSMKTSQLKNGRILANRVAWGGMIPGSLGPSPFTQNVKKCGFRLEIFDRFDRSDQRPRPWPKGGLQGAVL